MKRIVLLTSLATAIFSHQSLALAGPLENLERERALSVETMLDASLSVEERQKKLELSKMRLIDLERMVVRDDSIVGKDTPTVRVAFQNYDLTFLVHASVENQVTVTDQWFDQIGLSTHAIMDAQIGRR